MRHLTPWRKITPLAVVAILGLGAGSIQGSSEDASVASPAPNAGGSLDRGSSKVVTLEVVGRVGDDRLVPFLGLRSNPDPSTITEETILALTVSEVPLSFDDLGGRDRSRLLARHGRDAHRRYERGLALQLRGIVEQVRADHPTSRVAIVGVPTEPGTGRVAETTSNYRTLAGTADFIPVPRNRSRSRESTRMNEAGDPRARVVPSGVSGKGSGFDGEDSSKRRRKLIEKSSKVGQ